MTRGKAHTIFNPAGLRRGPLPGLLLALFAMFATAFPATAGDNTAAADAAAADDVVVGQVLRLLREGVSEGVIRSWLETSGERPAEVTPDDLIRLDRAGASDPLLEALLALAGRPPAPPPAPPPPAAPAPAPPTAGAGNAGEPGGIEVRLRAQYRSIADEDEEPWDLYLYLDGDILAWLPGGRPLFLSPEQEVTARLTAGRHVLRLAQERHSRRGDGWFHEARVAPEPLSFEIRPGDPVFVDLKLREVRAAFTGDGVASFLVMQGGEVLREVEALPEPEEWPRLCEDIEANLDPDRERPPRPVRAQLERCARWRSLWPEEMAVPDREEIRARLERYDFQPVPIDI